MAIRRYEPFSVLNELSRELGRMSEARGDADNGALATSDWVPAVDVREETGAYVIEADLPGVRAEDVDVQMERGQLSISGQRAAEPRDSEHGYRRVERATGTFHRRFSLPESADPDAISARLNNGVLRVEIPKQQQVQPRRIQVNG